MDTLFPVAYEASRARFRREAKQLSTLWPTARLETYPLQKFPAFSIDWLWAEPRVKENLVVLSTGQHGVEGYVGAAMLKVFMDEFAPCLNPDNTGVLLIHAINPWGMHHHRRVNPNQVDLNRNFIVGGAYRRDINPDYDLVNKFLNPQRPVRALKAETIPFAFRVIQNLIRPGRARVQAATLLGQHRYPRGIFFGGTQVEEETAVLINLYRRALADYHTFLQIDLHTGYGPRYQMTVIVPPFTPTASAELRTHFRYPLVQKINADEFYAISGTMGEYVFRLHEAEFAGKPIFGCGFEFGTFGDSFGAILRSLRILILENQLGQYGAVSAEAERQIRAEYAELFYPSEVRWRNKAIADARQAFAGILAAQQLV